MYLFFDTETSGLPRNWNAPVTNTANWPRLVQLAWILFDETGKEISRNDHIVKPEGFTISAATAAIHRITTEIALQEGIDLTSVLEEFHEQVDKANFLVAHNMKFDEKILGAEFLRTKRPNPFPKKRRICTMEAGTNYCAIPSRYGYKWPKLEELHYKLFQTHFEEAHNAAADIEATAKCFWELKRLGVM